MPLGTVSDPVFSQLMLGKGIAIEPTQGRVVAPFDGTILLVFHTMHALGLQSDTGVELLIHIGLETVKLNGKHFKSYVQVGDRVKIGDLLMEFDIEKIKSEGYQMVTPIIVSNTDHYSDFTTLKLGEVTETEEILKVIN